MIEIVIKGNISKRFTNLKQGIAKVGHSITKKSADILKDEIINAIEAVDAVASGDLIKSIDTNFGFNVDNYFVEVGSDAEQAYWIEFGRKPSKKMPPIDAIYDWMIQKGIKGNRSDAYRIARKIQQEGYEAREPFTKGFTKALPIIEKYIGKAVETELNIRNDN